MNSWRSIWGKRELVDESGSLLSKLILADGFDSPLGSISESAWRGYVQMFMDYADIVNGESIFEVGCGSGAFLLPFYEKNFHISGVDFSRNLIQIAKTSMPDAEKNFNLMEASSLSDSPKFDVVLANHVFHYFPSLEYASIVLSQMLSKSNRAVALLGMPDFNTKDKSEAERRGLLSEGEYERKYDGIGILYFQKDWISKIAIMNGFTAQFFPHRLDGFPQAIFRFDCLMNRN